MFKLYFLLSVGLMLIQVSRACDEENQIIRHQQSDEYLASAYEFNSNLEMFHPMAYYESGAGARVPEFYASPYEGRTPFTKRPTIQSFKKQLNNRPEENNKAEGRFVLGSLGANLINTGLFNNRFTPANTWRPFQNLANLIPVSYNPNFNNRPINAFDACTSFSGDTGICAPGNIYSLFGGRPSGSCVLGKVCCINAITTCGGRVTLNNTYWQSPNTAVSSPSTCALTVRMDTKLVEQFAKPICQIRLDFVSFSTTQPTAGTCTDTFTVGGSTSSVPIICGDNAGQHMYLDVPSSATTSNDVQLIFNFPAGTTATRSWNIKIAMLPCGASYLAPADCLQYFTAATGRVRSFNWQDVAGTATRQLNNQNYNICFRTELVPSQRATQICLSVCTVTNGGDAFSITTSTSTNAAAAAAAVVTATANLATAQTTLTNAQATLATAQTTLANAQTTLTTAEETVTTTQATLTAAQNALVTAQAAVPVAETALTDAQGALTTAQTDLATAQGTLTDSQTALAAAETDLAAANAAVDDPDNPTADETAAIAAAQAVVDAATTDANNAQTAFDIAETAANTAQTDVNIAQTTFTNAETAATDAQTAVDTAQLAADNAQTAVTTAQTAITDAEKTVANAQTDVDAAQPPVTTAQAALTAAQSTFDQAAAIAAALSGVGTSSIVNGVNTATCLYDFLLIAGARDSMNVEADRYCGNALNPAITPVATSVPVCTPIKQFRMTYRTDSTEGEVVAGTNILPAPADIANTGFCLDFQAR